MAKADQLRHKLTEALTLLTEDYCLLGDTQSALAYARRLVTLDPLNESAHRQLMQVYSQLGQHTAALKQYQTLEQTLRKELGLDPQPETRALYKQIRKGDIKHFSPGIQKETKTPRNNLPHRLTSFIGREQEQTEIIRLTRQGSPGHTRWRGWGRQIAPGTGNWRTIPEQLPGWSLARGTRANFRCGTPPASNS